MLFEVLRNEWSNRMKKEQRKERWNNGVESEIEREREREKRERK
jgi:hypothetical protein